jgi:hypothetical protein
MRKYARLDLNVLSFVCQRHTLIGTINHSYRCLSKKVWDAGNDEDTYSDSHAQILKKLDSYYRKLKRQILAFQSLTTGLFPNHLEHDKKIAHVVENVFCAIAVWSLRQCYWYCLESNICPSDEQRSVRSCLVRLTMIKDEHMNLDKQQSNVCVVSSIVNETCSG